MKTFQDFKKYITEEDDVEGMDSFDVETMSFDGDMADVESCECEGEHAHNSIKVVQRNLKRQARAKCQQHRPHHIHMKFVSAKNFQHFKDIKRSTQKRKKNK